MDWKKTFRWTAMGLGLLIATIVMGAFLVLRSQWFHRAILAAMVQKAQAETGGKVSIEGWNIRFRPLAIEIYDVVLRGSEPSSARPLLEIGKLTVGVKLGALLDRQLQLSELLIEHPVAHITVGRDGNSNFPNPPTTPKSNTTIWTLAVARSRLTRGEIFYNNQKSLLDADLYNLNTEIGFDPALTRYRGSISYQNGTLKLGQYSSLPHALEARFSVAPAGASVESLLLTVGSSRIVVHGQVVNFETPIVTAKYQILIHTQDFSSLAEGLSPLGDVHIDGEMQYQDVSGRGFLQTLAAEGNVSSAELRASLPEARVSVEKLGGRYQLAHGDLNLHDLNAGVIGGRIHAEFAVHNLEDALRGEFHATLQHASIESAKLAMRRANLRRVPVTGTVNAGIRGGWQNGLKNIHVLGDAQVKAAVWRSSANQQVATPVDAMVHLQYDAADNQITLRQTSVRIPAASAVVSGQISEHSRLQVHAASGDLHRLAELAASLSSSSDKSIPPINLNGKATMDAVVEGSLNRPSASGHIAVQDLEIEGSHWKTAQITLAASPSELKISQASLVNSRQGTLNLTGDVALKNWSYLPANTIQANLSAREISLSELEHLGMRNYPVAGTLSTKVSFHGSATHPSGHGWLEIVKANAYHQKIDDVSLQFQTANDSIESQIKITLPAGAASGTVAFTPKTRVYRLDLQAPQMVIQKFQVIVAENLPVAGTLAFSARGAGTLDNPQLTLTAEIPTLETRNTALRTVNAQVNIADHRAEVSLNSNITQTLNSNVAQAYVKAHANVDLFGDYMAQASMNTSQIPLGPFLAVYAPSLPEGFNGETELHASLDGPLKDRSKIVAHLTVPTFTATYQGLQFSNRGPIHADYSDSVLVLQPAEIRGTQTSIRLDGRVPVGTTAPMRVNAQGNVDLKVLAMFDSDVQTDGTADFDIHATGSLPHPGVQGRIQIQNASFTTSTAPAAVSKVNGKLDIVNEKIQITSLTGEIGGGQVTAGGFITLRPSLQFNVGLQGRNVRILYPAGVRSELDSDLTFTGDLKSAELRGRTLIQSLNFTPDFNLNSISGEFNTAAVPPLGRSFADNINLAISVQSSQNLAARSSQLNISGMANLRVGGTADNPVVTGRIDLASGELFYMSNRYELQRGIISFNDPNETRPVLNVQVTTTVEQYNLTLTLTGPLDRLTTSYVSSPALPTADIISLLFRGQTTEEAAAAGTSTDSILASGVASQFSSGLGNLAGISSLQIDPLLGGNGTNPSARIAVQQRVTKNFLFTFSTDVTEPENEIILGQYQLTPRWSVSVERDQLGGVSVDGQFRTKF
jgi:translocation and assembly module TamB